MNKNLLGIVNNILVLIMFIGFISISMYGLTYIYSLIDLKIFAEPNHRIYVGDFIVFYILPISLVVYIIVTLSMRKQFKLLEETSLKNVESDVKNIESSTEKSIIDNKKDAV